MRILKFIKRLFKIFLYGMLTLFSIILLTLFSFWIELKTNKSLPTLTGKYEVGRMALHLIDSSRTDSLSPPPFSKRELIVWIWYPAATTQTDSIVEYIHSEWSKALNEQRGLVLKNFFARDASKIHAHSFQSPKLFIGQVKYPVVLMKSGIGTMATDYSAFAEELASHGYIVVGNDAPYSTWLLRFPDGRLISRTSQGNPGETATFSDGGNSILNKLVQIWSDDTHFILDQLVRINADSSSMFFNRLDTSSVGIFGHSFGGATAAQFCSDDSRCKAGVDLDGAPFGSVIQKGLNKPFMFLLADHRNESDAVSTNIKKNIDGIYTSFSDNKVWIYLEGAGHFNFSDLPFQKEFIVTRLSGGTGSIGNSHGTEVISSCLLSFFDEHLRGQSKTNIKKLDKQFPEIKFAK